MERRARKTALTLTIEDYDNFLRDPEASNLGIDLLNQIIYMHGFKKIHKRPKHEVFCALSTIHLMNLRRSTLKDDSVCPYNSSLSLDHVAKDLEALSWKECSLQSILTVGHGGCCGGGGSCCGGAASTAVVAVASKELPADVSMSSSFRITRKRKMKKVMMASAASGRQLCGGGDVAYADVEYSSGCDAIVAVEGGEGDASLFVDTYRWDV